MTNPLVHAFFIGRVLAQTLSEQAEHCLTDTLSELAKCDAEQRERLRQFSDEVLERAERAEADMPAGSATTTLGVGDPTDLQATIDDLRAEIAQLRTELQQYRAHTA